MANNTPAERLESEFLRWTATTAGGDVFDFLAEYPAADLEDQAAVLLVDQARSWRNGHRQMVEWYLERLPALITRPDVLSQLIIEEYGYRKELGELIPSAEYARRFPKLESFLASLESTGSENLQNSDFGDSTVARTGSDTAPYDSTVPMSASRLNRIGRYEILGEIARGGMGVVYRAFDPQLDRTVALKLIKSGELAEADQIERFQTEAKAAAQLDHPGIVQIYEVGQFDGQHFLTMAFVDGHSLWQEVKGSPLAPKHAAKLMQQVAEAIQFAHDRGIVHRDLKPQNILLTKDGQPKVTDFGLAKRREQDGSLTQTGQALGTPSYMPPEQAKGQIKEIGPLADVYSLGATLYCLLTGRPPFQAATQLETMLQVVEQDPVSPKSLNRAVSVDLETICLRCLEKEPAKRYATAQTLAEDLQRYLIGEPIAARPISRLERVLKWIARKPMTAAAYGLTGLTAVLILIGATITMFWRNAEMARGEAESARSEAVAAKNEADSARDDALKSEEEAVKARDGEAEARKELEVTKAWNQYVLNVRLAPSLWEQGWIENARQALDDCPPTLRQWEWKYYHRKFHPEVARMKGHTLRVLDVALSPDETLLATCRDTARLWNASTGELVATMSDDTVVKVAFHPRGAQVAVGTDDKYPAADRVTGNSVVVWDIGQNRRAHQLRVSDGVLNLSYSPDGSRLAAGLRDGTLKLWRTDDYSEISAPFKHFNGVAHLAFRSDSQRLAVGCWYGFIYLWNPQTGQLIAIARAHEERPGKGFLGDSNMVFLSYSSDGRELVSVTRDRTVMCLDADNLDELAVWKRDGRYTRVALSPDGQRLTMIGDDEKTVTIWDVHHGRLVKELADQKGGYVQYSPDHQSIATAGEDDTIRLWDLDRGTLLSSFVGHVGNVTEIRFNADGSRMFSAGGSGMSAVWDLTELPEPVVLSDVNGELIAALSVDGVFAAVVYDASHIRVRNLQTGESPFDGPAAQGNIRALAFDPTGQRLASAGSDGTICLRSMSNPDAAHILRGHVGQVNDIQFSPDGQQLASAGEDQTIKLWDLESGAVRANLTGHTRGVKAVKFRPDGRQLASASIDNTVRVWDAAGGQETFCWTWDQPIPHDVDDYYWHLSYNPDGSQLASNANRMLKVWDTSTWSEVASLTGHHRILSIEFSPKGDLIAYGGWNTAIRVYDLLHQRQLPDLLGHTKDTRQLRFSPDGTRLASANTDGTVRLWNTADWQQMATLTGHLYAGVQLQYTPTGDRLVSVGYDGTVRNWIAEESPHEREQIRSARLRIWRAEALKRAEEAENWSAVAFHLTWLLKDRPDDQELQSRYEQAVARRGALARERQTQFAAQAVRKSNAINFAAERQVAEWVLSVGGKLYVQYPGEVNATLVDAVPERAFVINSINFSGNEKLQPSDLKNLRGLAGLQGLALNHTKLDHDSLLLAGEFPKLTSCSLVGNGTGDEGLKALSQSWRLQWINLQDSRITDQGLESLAQIEVPLTLYLTDCAVTGEGLHRLAGVPIQHLGICATKVQFADLPALVRDFPKLQSLDCRALGGEHGEGFAPLAQLTAFSSLTLDAQHLIAEAGSLAKVSRLTSIGVSFQRTPIPPEAVEACGKIPQATSVSLAHSQLAPGVIDALARNTTIQSLSLWHCAAGDEDLEPVSRMPQLKSLQLHSPDITPAGIERFRQLRPDVELNANDQNYPAMKPGK